MLKNSCCKSLKAGGLGFEPRSKVLETPILPLNYPPMVTGSLRVLALSFTLMAVPAEYAPLSFPPVWSGILELNQEPQSYQLCALTNCANAR